MGTDFCAPNAARCNFIEILTVDAGVCPRFALIRVLVNRGIMDRWFRRSNRTP
jgi:hypothetical protein